MEKKTPLYDVHVALGGKIVPFAGYSLPIQYSDITHEHLSVRNKAGLFDVSHMGEILLSGKDALQTVNNLLPNEYSNLAIEKARYSPMLNKNGGIVDDLIVYRLGEQKYQLVVNGANVEKDAAWINQNLIGDTIMQNISDEIGQVALQGPASKEIIKSLCKDEDIPKAYFSFKENANVGGITCILSRTGYTGSFGYEIYCKAADTVLLWQTIMEAGKPHGLVPCGLGARDTLRIEACMPLYGNEMTDDINPLEASLDFAVKLNKEDFIGKSALIEKGAPKRVRVGLKITGRGIVRGESEVYNGTEKVGVTTSGTLMPYLNAAYAMAMVISNCSKIGTKLSVDVRGRKIDAEVVEMPFYKI